MLRFAAGDQIVMPFPWDHAVRVISILACDDYRLDLVPLKQRALVHCSSAWQPGSYGYNY